MKPRCENCKFGRKVEPEDLKIGGADFFQDMGSWWDTRRVCTRPGGSYIVNERHCCSAWKEAQDDR